MPNQASSRALATKLVQEIVAHFRMAELVAFHRARYLAQWNVARITPVACMECAVQIDKEVKEGIVSPGFLGQMKGIMRVGNVLQRKTLIQAEGETMEHNCMLEF